VIEAAGFRRPAQSQNLSLFGREHHLSLTPSFLPTAERPRRNRRPRKRMLFCPATLASSCWATAAAKIFCISAHPEEPSNGA